jgi:hypothetical protein
MMALRAEQCDCNVAEENWLYDKVTERQPPQPRRLYPKSVLRID